MVLNPLATAKMSLGLGGDAAATAGAATGADDGNDGGGNDGYDMVEVDMIRRRGKYPWIKILFSRGRSSNRE